MQVTDSSAAIVAAGRDASSPTSRRALQEAHSTTIPSPSAAAADLSMFLAPSFDASSYVASLLQAVNADHKSSELPSTSSTAGKQLQLTPSSPTARRVSLSQTTPLQPGKDSASRKREQAQEDLDLSLAISRLNLAIEELDRSISTQVTAHAPELLRRTTGLALMQTGAEGTSAGVKNLDEQVRALKAKVHHPFVRLVELQAELKVVDGASGLTSRARAVVGLARRLEGQMDLLFGKDKNGEEGEDAVVGKVHGRDLARAALLVSELTALLDAESKTSPSQENGESDRPSLHDLKLTKELLPFISTARKTIVDYMEDMIVRGLRDLSPLMLGSSLQTAFNLRILPTLVQDLLNDLTQVVKERTAAAFDLDTLSRQLQLPLPTLEPSTSYSTYRGTRKTGNTDDESRKQHLQQQQIWSEAVWKKLESLIVVEMGAVCSKVYMLEKVLKLKSDSETGVNFLAAALEVLGDRPSYTFWLTFAQSLKEQVAMATGRSAWLAQLLSGGVRAGDGYPKMVRLFQEFFAKISLYTDVQYTTTNQSPETVIMLKSLGGLETAYVEKSTSRIAELLSQVTGAGGRRSSVGEEEAEMVVQSIGNVLDATRFDPLLERAVVTRCTTLIDRFLSQLDKVVAKDDSAWMLTGDTTQSQEWNAGLVRFAHALVRGLRSLAADQDGSTLPTTTAHAAQGLASTQLHTSASNILSAARASLIDSLLTRVHTSITSKMSKMHVQLASTHSSSAVGSKGKQKRGVSIDATTGASGYASSICETLSFLRDELLPLYPAEVRTGIAQRVARWVVELFCLHASITSLPAADGDRIKLRLATDMTEFEFALTQLVGDRPPTNTSWVETEAGLLKEDWIKTIKAFRRLLFLSLDEVEEEEGRGLQLPVLVVVLHLLSRQEAALDSVLRETVGKSDKGQNVKSDFVAWVRTRSQEETLTGLGKVLAGGDEQMQRLARLFLTKS